MKYMRPILIAGLILFMAAPGRAEQRKVHRASQVGGTGMMFMRIGDQLDPGEMNASIFLEYMAFSKLPLNPTRIADPPYVDDPRGNGELWTVLTYNYGINHLFEVGAQIPLVFISDLRDAGIGRIGFDGRLLILNPDKMGLGVSSTIWMSFPSFQLDNSSTEFNAGGEVAFMALGAFGTNYMGSAWFDRWVLEPLRLYANIGWGYEDYLKFGKIHIPAGPRNPDDPELCGSEVLYGSLGMEFEVYDQLFVGTELLARQWPDYHNDNNFTFIIPEVTYTHKDIFTVGLALGLTEFGTYNHQPDWLIKAGFTYHFPELVWARTPQPEGTPPEPTDLIDVFTPSRKPVPTEGGSTETPFSPDEGGNNGEGDQIPTEPVQ